MTTTAYPQPPPSYEHLADPFHTGASLDSMEGVPDYAPAAPPTRAQAALADVAPLLPGIALAFALAYAGTVLSDVAGRLMGYAAGKSPLSAITLAVLFGLIIRNTIGVPKAYEAGLRLCLKTVLRLGIVVLGLTLSLAAVGKTVLAALPVTLASIASAILLVTLVTKALGLPRRLGTLIAVGTSVCGVSAIVATAPVIDAEEDETAYAVATITLFGLVALLTYPFLAHALFASPNQAGTFLGTAIHDTSQVAGAGLAYAQQYAAPEATETAVTVKLLRNLSMAVLIPLMAVWYRRGEEGGGATRKVAQPWHAVLPLFVLGFLAMACVRSVGDATPGRPLGVFTPEAWKRLDPGAKYYATWLLATALGAVGLGTGLAKLKGLGLKPLTVGLAAAVLVGCVSAGLIKVLAPLIH